ncbi:MAG: hypothetical protein ABFQ62_02510 [Patescibacteria group bacterium]
MDNVEISSIYPRCVDGRKAGAFLEWDNDGNKWIVVKKGKEAEAENGPQFLGASLLFVKALEELAEKAKPEAFDLTQQASESVGMGLQIHLDDKHGEYNLSEMSDDEIIDMVINHHGGCGFSVYAWGQEVGPDYIDEAKKRGWRIQILVDEHDEGGARENYVDGETFDTAAAVDAGEARFNTDVEAAKGVCCVRGNIG